MEKLSLCRDLMRNPRDSEDSRIVASKWGNATDPYLSEIPAASNTQYFNLTAERLLYRSKLLSLPVDQALAECEAIQSARPFGELGPNFPILRDASVRMAMAFVPLTPTSGNGKPLMARLYCVIGLPAVYRPPFLEGVDEPCIDSCAWFVAGVPAVFNGEVLSGRSWLLAANLLRQVVNTSDVATARNLATSFIVTGDVESGSIKEVDLGQKPNLANIKEYRTYKWIIPMKNANEMTNIPSRKIEKPATLDEAYKLIETLQSKATRSFFRFLKEGDLEGMKEQYEIGADIYAEDEESNRTPLEYIDKQIGDLQGSLGREPSYVPPNKPDEWNKRLKLLRELKNYKSIRSWLQLNGANCATSIYLIAKSGDDQSLAHFVAQYPINAIDECGLTATDYALLAEDWSAAGRLIALGGVCDESGKKNPAIKIALEAIVHCGERFMATSFWKCLDFAFSAGLPINTAVHFMDAIETKKGIIEELWRLQIPLLGLAIYDGNKELLKFCVDHGADVNEPMKVDFIENGYEQDDWVDSPDTIVDGNDFVVVGTERILPLAFSYFLNRVDDSIISLLRKMGAQETSAVAEARSKWEAKYGTR